MEAKSAGFVQISCLAVVP